VNDELPTVVGVPDSTPVAVFRLRPAGRLPAVIDQTSGAVPPVSTGCWL